MGRPQSTTKTMFSSSLRSGALRQWEPIFIGTKKDPTYDPRLTWEGRADKMVIVNFFYKRYIFLLLAVHSETKSLQAIWHFGSSMLEAFEFCIGPFIYHVVLLSVVGESSLFLSMPWIYISHRFDFHCYLAGWRSEDVPQKVFVFFHSTILNYNAYTAIWCKSHTFWVRRLYHFVLLLASK